MLCGVGNKARGSYCSRTRPPSSDSPCESACRHRHRLLPMAGLSPFRLTVLCLRCAYGCSAPGVSCPLLAALGGSWRLLSTPVRKGGALASQAEGRGSNPRRPLHLQERRRPLCLPSAYVSQPPSFTSGSKRPGKRLMIATASNFLPPSQSCVPANQLRKGRPCFAAKELVVTVERGKLGPDSGRAGIQPCALRRQDLGVWPEGYRLA